MRHVPSFYLECLVFSKQ